MLKHLRPTEFGDYGHGEVANNTVFLTECNLKPARSVLADAIPTVEIERANAKVGTVGLG
jgi:hypothetical protein